MRTLLQAGIRTAAVSCIVLAVRKVRASQKSDGLAATSHPERQEQANPADQLNAMLAEYNTLRCEILQAMDNRIKIVFYTFAALSVVLNGTIIGQSFNVLAGTISLLIIPQVAKSGMLIWLGEYHRVWRAGRWIAKLEEKMNEVVSLPGAMSWETLQSPGAKNHPPHEISIPLLYPAAATIVLALVPGYIGSALGAGLLFSFFSLHFSTFFAWVTVVVIAVYVAILEVWFIWFFRVRWRRARYGAGEVAKSASRS